MAKKSAAAKLRARATPRSTAATERRSLIRYSLILTEWLDEVFVGAEGPSRVGPEQRSAVCAFLYSVSSEGTNEAFNLSSDGNGASGGHAGESSRISECSDTD